MPRPRKGARLYLRPARADREALWVILDGASEVSTGCRETERERAEKALAEHIANKYEAPKATPRLVDLLVADVVTVYLKEKAPRTKSAAWIGYMADPIIDWWGQKTLAMINAGMCNAYVDWRVKQGVSDQTPRHELKTLRAAVFYYHKNYGPLPVVPAITLPRKAPPRMDYWLTRDQLAARIRAARRLRYTRHLSRFLLIGFYTGTRPGAILKLRWLPSTDGGWFDLDANTLHRRGQGSVESNKRQPPARINEHLLPHLRRWRDADIKKGVAHVVHFYGRPIIKLRRSWKAVAIEAGHDGSDAPHILRHTAATYLMQSGVDPYEAAGYLGMSVETLLEVYGHHHPNFQKNAASASGKRAQETPKKSPSNRVSERHQRQSSR